MAEPDLRSIVDETVRFVTVRPHDDGWTGDAPEWFGRHLFGGFILAQAVHAMCQTAPSGRRIHSFHAYFLRPALAGVPLVHRITELRHGRSFAIYRLESSQEGSPVFTSMCSFTADTDGYAYEMPLARDVPAPESLDTTIGPGPWAMADVGPTPPEPDGTRRSTRRAWYRVGAPLPDDPHIHTALVAFATDMTWTGGRPLHLEGDVRGLVSLDHAVWFHRPLRADEWLFYDVHSLINWGGRGVLRGTIHGPDRRLAVSVTQEMRITPFESPKNAG
jgi:acyl-CoA thioesterase-2